MKGGCVFTADVLLCHFAGDSRDCGEDCHWISC